MTGEEMGQGTAAAEAEQVGSKRGGRKRKSAREVDEQLVEEAIRGDSDAVDRVVTAYYQDILYFVIKKVGAQAGEDVTQQAIGNIIDSLGSLQDPAKLKSWMMSIANHCCADYLRKTIRTRSVFTVCAEFDEDACDIEERCHEFLPEQALIDSETRNQVIAAIDSLPQNYADALRLYYLDGLSYSEIGEALGVDYRKVQNDLHNGRSQFKKRYEAATGAQLRFSSLDAGALPVLTQALMADRDQTISPKAAERTLDFIHKHISGGAVAGAAAAPLVSGQAVPVAKLVLGAFAVFTVGAAATFGLLPDDQQGQVVQEPVQLPVQEEVEPEAPQAQAQEDPPIETVADMIGEDEAAQLEAFEAAGADVALWREFIERIGAEESRVGADGDYIYTMYVLQKQDKQLILADRADLSDGSVAVVSLFGPKGDLPRITKVMLMFP